MSAWPLSLYLAPGKVYASMRHAVPLLLLVLVLLSLELSNSSLCLDCRVATKRRSELSGHSRA